jgi:hypothetical protein
MKIFLSWSGPRSRAVAKALNDWLPNVIQGVEPFYSPEIERGVRFNNAIDAALASAQFGIICLTPDNLQSRWIHYEAGALSKSQKAGASTGGQSTLWTFLHGLTVKEVPFPLGNFQHTVAKKDDVFRLIQSINGRLKIPLGGRVLGNAFEQSWSSLKKMLKAANKLAPHSPVSNDAEFRKFVDLGIEEVHKHLDDQDLQEFLKGAKNIKVLKTWFPESRQIAAGLKCAIMKGAKVKLLLLKPGTDLLKERSLGAGEKDWWGSFMIHYAVDVVHKSLLEKQREADRRKKKCEPGRNLEEQEQEPRVRIAFYNSWPGCPVIWYDKTILVGFYIRGKSSPSWPWLRINKRSDLAKALEKQFDDLWKDAKYLDTPKQMKSWLRRNKGLAPLGVVPETSAKSKSRKSVTPSA